jgi:D-alanyl-D-alanine carboxypeptidase
MNNELRKKIKKVFIILLFLSWSFSAQALDIQDFALGAVNNGLTAESYMVIDSTTGNVLMQKDIQKVWTPASLTKLITALVVLDKNPRLQGNVTIKKIDEVGGARIVTKPGVSYKVKDLFFAMLVASANNATNALARSTGLSSEEFVGKMNEKAKVLGALSTTFIEPTGISEKNLSTVEDYAKIARSAFANQSILLAAKTAEYSFRSTNNKRYLHKIKNTNKLLKDAEMEIIAGKTGYLDESKYNFTALVKDQFNQSAIIVLFGAKDSSAQFRETKQLTFLSGLAKQFNFLSGAVLGTSDTK